MTRAQRLKKEAEAAARREARRYGPSPSQAAQPDTLANWIERTRISRPVPGPIHIQLSPEFGRWLLERSPQGNLNGEKLFLLQRAYENGLPIGGDDPVLVYFDGRIADGLHRVTITAQGRQGTAVEIRVGPPWDPAVLPVGGFNCSVGSA